jgi:hypothetical protein
LDQERRFWSLVMMSASRPISGAAIKNSAQNRAVLRCLHGMS